MNRFLSIDVLRGVIMIIMALDHVIGAVSLGHDTEVSFVNEMFRGYASIAQQCSRLLTHLCAPGFQLLAGMGLAISVARAQQNGTSEGKITSDLLNRAWVLLLADFLLMLPVFKAPLFFMVLACIGSCTFCFVFLRYLPRHWIGLAGLAIIAAAPWYKSPWMLLAGTEHSITPQSYLINIWTEVGFGPMNSMGMLYPILPWLGIFAIGWWIGLMFVQTPQEQGPGKSALGLTVGGFLLVCLGIALRMTDWRRAESMPLNGATIMDSTFWQFTKYPPSWVFIALTIGVLLMLLGIFRALLDRSDNIPFWTCIITVYGRTALFYFVVHFYLIGIIAVYLGMVDEKDPAKRYTIGQAYLVWLAVLAMMWPICWVYDKLRQRYRTVLRYF